MQIKYINIYLAALAALIVLVGLEFLFRFRFLRSLTVIPNFRPERKMSYFEQVNERNEKNVLLMKALLYLLFGVLLGVYAFMKEMSTVELAILLIVSLVICIYGITYLVALAKRKK